MPISDVTKARAGDELSFKTLLYSKFLKAQLFVTYDGRATRLGDGDLIFAARRNKKQ